MVGIKIIKFWLENLIKWEGRSREEQVWKLKARSQFLIFYSWCIYESHLHSCGFHEMGFPSRIPGPAPALHSLPLSHRVKHRPGETLIPTGPFPCTYRCRLQGKRPVGFSAACGQMLRPSGSLLSIIAADLHLIFQFWLFSVMKRWGLDLHTLDYFGSQCFQLDQPIPVAC